MSSAEEDEDLQELKRLLGKPRLTPAEKTEELAKAYADAKERGEDPEKALREKYRELNPEPAPTSKTPQSSSDGSADRRS